MWKCGNPLRQYYRKNHNGKETAGADLISRAGMAGSVCGCIGFVKDRNTRLNVPNMLLKKDIRDVTASPVQKVYAVLSKNYMAERYSVLEKADREIDMRKCFFSERIENMLERESFSCAAGMAGGK